MVGPVTLAEIHSYGLVGDISSDEMGRRREEIAAAPLGREVCCLMGQPAPGRPAFMTGSSRAPCAFDPNDVGFVRPTRS